MNKLFFLFLVISSPLHADTTLPSPGHDRFQKALAAMQENALDEAEEHFKEALMLEPMNAEYRFEFANLYAMRRDEFTHMGDEAGAQEKLRASAQELEQAVMAKPDFLAARFNLGVVYKNLGKYEAAREAFKEVLRLDPNQGPAQLQIGNTYEEQGFFDDAETIYQDLLERYPHHPELENSMERLQRRREVGFKKEMQERQMRQMAVNTGLSALRDSDS